jgi:hypothetical protein
MGTAKHMMPDAMSNPHQRSGARIRTFTERPAAKITILPSKKKMPAIINPIGIDAIAMKNGRINSIGAHLSSSLSS